MSFRDDVDEVPDRRVAEVGAEREHAIALELAGQDAALLEALGARLCMDPRQVVRLALHSLAGRGRRR